MVNRLGSMPDLPMPDTFYLIEQTAQIKYLHTIIRFIHRDVSFDQRREVFFSRNKLTGRDEFIFYSKRLMRILIEHALSLLPFEVISRQFSVENPRRKHF